MSLTFFYLLLYGTPLLLELFAIFPVLSPGYGYILNILNYRLFSDVGALGTGHWAHYLYISFYIIREVRISFKLFTGGLFKQRHPGCSLHIR